MIDAYDEMRKAMESYYTNSAIEQLEPAPTRVELGIYDELEGEVSEAANQVNVEGDGRKTEEAERLQDEAPKLEEVLRKQARQRSSKSKEAN